MIARRTWVLLLLSTLTAVRLHAQQPVPPAPASADSGETSRLAQGWGCLARKDLACAAEVATTVMAQFPRSAAGASLAIEVELARRGADDALTFYERWVGARVEEPALLRRLAVARLEEAARQPQDPASQFRSTTALLDAGDPGARARLAEAAAGGGLAEMRLLASRGDAASVKALAASVEAGVPNAVAAIQALGESGSSQATPVLLAKLTDLRPEVRGAAAEALGLTGGLAVVPRLKALLNDPSGFVRSKAASALFRLKDPAGSPVLATLAASDSTYSKLVAAEAMQSQPDSTWQALVTALTRATEPDVRLAAARLAARFDPALATATLRALTDDTNVAIRQEASRSLAREVSGDSKALRTLLRHPDSMTRTEAAASIVKATN